MRYFFAHICSLWIFLRWVSLLIFSPLDFGEVFFYYSRIWFQNLKFLPLKGLRSHIVLLQDFENFDLFFSLKDSILRFFLQYFELFIFNFSILGFEVDIRFFKDLKPVSQTFHSRLWNWKIVFLWKVWDSHLKMLHGFVPPHISGLYIRNYSSTHQRKAEIELWNCPWKSSSPIPMFDQTCAQKNNFEVLIFKFDKSLQ